MNYPKLIVKVLTFPIWGPFWIIIILFQTFGALLVWMRPGDLTWNEAKRISRDIPHSRD